MENRQNIIDKLNKILEKLTPKEKSFLDNEKIDNLKNSIESTKLRIEKYKHEPNLLEFYNNQLILLNNELGTFLEIRDLPKEKENADPIKLVDKIEDKFNRIMKELDQFCYDINRDERYTREDIICELESYIKIIDRIISEP